MVDFAKELGDNDSNEIIEKNSIDITSTELFEAESRINVDVQVATAHSFPRNLKKVLDNILFLATQDKETAENCFYSVKRDNKTIRGASIRLAEIITACYGNIRASSRIIANDGKMITAQGMCWDLENNVAFSVEVRRKITDKYGRTYSDDMQVITSNACASIALRNAIFKVVPMAITSRIQTEIKKIVLGESKDFETTRINAVEYFVNLGVAEKNILSLFDRKTIEDLDRDDIFDLRGIATAIREGDTTLEASFSVSPKVNTAIGKASKILSVPMEEGEAEYEKTNIAKPKEVIEVPKVEVQVKEGILKEGEKEIVFGENTEPKKEIVTIESEEVISSYNPEVITNVKPVEFRDFKAEEIVIQKDETTSFEIEPVVDPNINPTDIVVDTPVITIPKEKRKYKKFKKGENGLFDQKDGNGQSN